MSLRNGSRRPTSIDEQTSEEIPLIATNMKVRRFATPLQCFMIGLVFMNVSPSGMQAQDSHSHSATAEQQEATLDQQAAASTLLKIVRDSTERFQDVTVAQAAGYALQFGCVTGDDAGQWGCTTSMETW